MNKTINVRMQQKADTSENWNKTASFIPLKGEICVYTDLNKIKLGNGINTIADLPFIEGESGTSSYIFSDNFAVNGDYVALQGDIENITVDLSGKDTYTINTPTDGNATISLTGTNSTAMLNAGLHTQIISSRGGTLISLPKGTTYVSGMDLSGIDHITIPSLHNGEYIDKDGKLYSYQNINAAANGTTNAPYSAMNRSSSNEAISTITDGLTAICFRRDCTGYNPYSAIYNYWKENTDNNGTKYYQFRSTGYGFEKSVSGWKMCLDFIYPKTTSEVPFVYASFPDADGKLVQFKPVSYDEFLTTTAENVCTLRYVNSTYGILFYFKPAASYGYNVSGTTLRVGSTAINNAWVVVKTREVAYEKTIENKIPTYVGGQLIFIPDESSSEYASYPTMTLNTYHYSAERGAEYASIKLGEKYDGQCSGILKYSLTAGVSDKIGTNVLTNGIIEINKDPVFPSVIGTQGTLQNLETKELFGYNQIYEE